MKIHENIINTMILFQFTIQLHVIYKNGGGGGHFLLKNSTTKTKICFFLFDF